MQTLSTRAAITILVVLLLAACAPDPEPQQPVRFTVGLHDISLMEPAGWQHLDHGLEHRFRNDTLNISVADIGPVTREGYLRELNHALKLFRSEQVQDAQAHLDSLQLRSNLFSPRDWDEISDAWYVAHDGGLTKPVSANDVELAYLALLQQVEWMEPATTAALVERIMPTLFFGAHREIAEQETVTVDGRKGIRLSTWDRLSHDHRKDFLLVLNNENMLVLRMELGDYAGMQPVFDALLESLEIHPRPQGSGGSTS